MATIRKLRHDEPVPDGEPKRYRNGTGYVRLRWLVAPQTYVEEYEHRIVAGRPHPRFDVHHLNGVKDDNRPENLRVLTRAEHAALHGVDRESLYAPYRSRSAKEKAERARANREKREARRGRIRELYEEGLTTTEVAAVLGLTAGTVSRELRAAGGVARSTGPTTRTRQLVHARAGMRCERCANDVRYGGGQVHHRQPRKMGGTSRPEANHTSNLLLLCGTCHAHIEANRSEAYDFGWLVREPTDPATVPVLLAVGWVLLGAEGRCL
jgi:AraC-like DNA-binding protein